MSDLDRIREVKTQAKQRLFALPGVHCVAVGPKKTAGKITGQNAILVYVTEKKPLGALEPAEVIPSEIDGVKVDVIESPVPRLLADEQGYDPLCGGIQIQSGGDYRGEGTLGFIAQSSDGQKIYAVTCQHVLLVARSLPSGLQPTTTPAKTFATSVTIQFKGPLFGAITTGTVVAVRVIGVPALQGLLQTFAVVMSTPEGAHETDVAIKIRDELNAVGLVKATQSGSTVTITPGASLAKIEVLCDSYGKQITESSGLDASVAGNTITFSGQAGDPGGAFVNINVGGQNPSYGLFVPIASGDDATTVATNTISALTALKNEDRAKQPLSSVTVQQTGAQVTIGGADEIECEITQDDRVGQPTNCFCCRHHKCCSSRIGRVVAVAMDFDAALIQLDGEQEYIAKVEGIPENGGAVHNTATANMSDPVQKRGRTSGLTSGKVTALDADGIIGFKTKTWPNPSFFHRYYRNSIRIDADSGDFSQEGDSGSAVMDHNNNIVGLLFGGGEHTGHGVASPIAGVLDAFKAFSLVVAKTTDLQPLTVPGPSFAFAALPAGSEISPVVGGTPLFHDLRKAEAEIESIAAGKELSDAIRRHASEGYRLVTTNRRVGAVWKRNGGQQIFPALLRLLQNPAAQLPGQIGDRPLVECLTNIRRIFERYGSPSFAAELRQRGDQLISLMSLSYIEMKAALESAGPR
jgi:hypothetical protein